MKGKLNLFQAAMGRWRELHPYKAVHLVHVPRPLDAARLEAGIRRRLEELGLTGLGLDRRRLRYEWSGGASAATLARDWPPFGQAALWVRRRRVQRRCVFPPRFRRAYEAGANRARLGDDAK